MDDDWHASEFRTGNLRQSGSGGQLQLHRQKHTQNTCAVFLRLAVFFRVFSREFADGSRVFESFVFQRFLRLSEDSECFWCFSVRFGSFSGFTPAFRVFSWFPRFAGLSGKRRSFHHSQAGEKADPRFYQYFTSLSL